MNKIQRPGNRPKTAKPALVKLALDRDLSALRSAVALDRRAIVRIDGKDVAVISLRDLRRLERLLEQEAQEEELDRLDVEEAERRLADPTEVPIPFEQAIREIELGHLSD